MAHDSDRPDARALTPVVYDELRRLAGRYLSHESVGQTLQTHDLIHEAFQFRTILELAAVRHFAVHADAATVGELEASTTAVLRRFDGAAVTDPRLLDAALQVDWRLHDLIVESMGNRIMFNAHQTNFDKIRMIRLHGRSPRYIPLALEEHLVVIKALKQRDADRAAAGLEHHLKCAERRALGL